MPLLQDWIRKGFLAFRSTRLEDSPMDPDTLAIEGKEVRFKTPEGKTYVMSVAELLRHAIPKHTCTGGVQPNHIRMMDSSGPLTVWVYEIPPSVRQLQWIAADSPAQFGPGTKYRQVRISLPYLIVLAVFQDGELANCSECFFRNDALRTAEDPLFYPALLNCSKFVPAEGKPLSWICTQKLDRSPIENEPNPDRKMAAGLRALLKTLLESGFNLSSEHHEANSWFSESNRVDPRVKTIEAWVAATEKDPLMGLTVPWIPVGKSLREVIDRIFENQHHKRKTVATARDIARLVVAHGKSA